MNIGSYTLDEFVQKVKSFHGNPSPGVTLGGIMVDMAQRNLPENTLYDAICETEKCLPDAIQMLTPCTFGNGWMRIINSGRFSVTLYDKHTGEGIRVFVDPVKVKAFPEIDKWFFCLVPKKETDVNKLMEEVREFGSKVLGMRRVKVDIKSLPSPEEYKYALCSVCGESHIDDGKDVCLACRGKAYISDIRE
jgi:formylmethanofuran dehydrogenase subunit E